MRVSCMFGIAVSVALAAALAACSPSEWAGGGAQQAPSLPAFSDPAPSAVKSPAACEPVVDFQPITGVLPSTSGDSAKKIIVANGNNGATLRASVKCAPMGRSTTFWALVETPEGAWRIAASDKLDSSFDIVTGPVGNPKVQGVIQFQIVIIAANTKECRDGLKKLAGASKVAGQISLVPEQCQQNATVIIAVAKS